jgi:hydrogenase-1 operon protein HyaE
MALVLEETKVAPDQTSVRKLAREPGACLLDVDDVDAFAAGAGLRVLFFSGEGKRRPEAQDVAVVLRELLRKNLGRLEVGVLTDMAENKSKVRLGVIVLPTVVLMRDGEKREAIARIQDWPVYSDAIARHIDA